MLGRARPFRHAFHRRDMQLRVADDRTGRALSSVMGCRHQMLRTDLATSTSAGPRSPRPSGRRRRCRRAAGSGRSAITVLLAYSRGRNNRTVFHLTVDDDGQSGPPEPAFCQATSTTTLSAPERRSAATRKASAASSNGKRWVISASGISGLAASISEAKTHLALSRMTTVGQGCDQSELLGQQRWKGTSSAPLTTPRTTIVPPGLASSTQRWMELAEPAASMTTS